MPGRPAHFGDSHRAAGRALIVALLVAVACVRPTGASRAGVARAARPGAAGAMSAPAAATEATAGAGRLSRAALVRSAPAGTYILDVLAAQQFEVVRWPEHVRTPVRVWIGDGSRLPGWRATFPAVVRGAFTEWCTVGIPVRVVFVRDSARADVRVRWVDHFGDDVSARTTWQYDEAGLIRSGRTVLSTRRADGTPRTDAQLRAIALHEVGHALGLQHALGSTSSIMTPRVDVPGLSDEDRATVRLLYSLPPGRMP